jgi:hypothetical protein
MGPSPANPALEECVSERAGTSAKFLSFAFMEPYDAGI